MQQLALATPTVMIELVDGRPTTTSLDVAKHFKKRHDTVLRAIRQLDCSSDFLTRNFAEMIVEVETGKGATRKSPAFHLTRDGFTFLCMGFTGEEAAKWKEAYIHAFNRMEAELRSPIDIAEPANCLTLTYEGRHFRILHLAGDPWFVAADVSTALGLRDSHVMLRHLDNDQKAKQIIGKQTLNVINAAGLERTFLHARPDKAESVRAFVIRALALHQVNPQPVPKAVPNGLSSDQQIAITALVKACADELPKAKRAKVTAACWASLESEFGCTYEQIPPESFGDAIGLVTRVVLEGELLDPEAPKVIGRLDINYPIEDWKGNNPRQFRRDDPNSPDLSVGYGDLLRSKYSPSLDLFRKLQAAGYCIDGPLCEFRAHQDLMFRMDTAARLLVGSLEHALENFESSRQAIQKYSNVK